jgi:hypothetical protein
VSESVNVVIVNSLSLVQVLFCGGVRCFVTSKRREGWLVRSIDGLEEGHLTGTNVNVRRYRTLRYFLKDVLYGQ